jgi:hypothetical protein
MLHSRQSWRDRAEEYRTFADAAKDSQVRAGYIQLAEHCDALAVRQELAERTLKGSSGVTKPSQEFG